MPPSSPLDAFRAAYHGTDMLRICSPWPCPVLRLAQTRVTLFIPKVLHLHDGRNRVLAMTDHALYERVALVQLLHECVSRVIRMMDMQSALAPRGQVENLCAWWDRVKIDAHTEIAERHPRMPLCGEGAQARRSETGFTDREGCDICLVCDREAML
ncbi:hypothetical protein FA95DRAFT_1339347 [Auriscalpium vulgare]|uniref:Uncharacterized protein n=1 Tax=Auriscalpium vulgare TaxID=40419 RepID=A0ACB8R1L5_9AGAM|nr:hypothetical protein FA95DRAFT_1339347 [Auriscalpium vulgare]